MSKGDGNYLRMRIGSTNLGLTTSVEITFDKDFQNTTNQDSAGWQEMHPTSGVRKASGSFDLFYDPDGIFNAEEIIAMVIGNSGLVTIDVGQIENGKPYWRFTGIIKGVTLSAKNDSVVTCKGSFESSGAISILVSTGSAGS